MNREPELDPELEADPFAHDDAAYVLGALDPDDRARFEAHLDTCAACRARVAELAGLPALLDGLSVDDLAAAAGGRPADDVAADDVAVRAAGPVPDLILPRLVAEVQRERRRRRIVLGGLSAAVAACVLALVIAVWPQSQPATPAARAFSPVATSGIQASATLVSTSWGTEVRLHCKYASGIAVPDAGWQYDLVAVTASGSHYLGDWTLREGTTISYTTGTALPSADIRALEIRTPTNQTVLRLTL